MMSKLTTQHKWILVLLVFVLVNAAVWMWGLAPALKRVQAAHGELDQTEQRRDRLQQQLEQLNAIDCEALGEQQVLLNPRVPEQGLLREFIHGLVDMAEVAGMPLPSVSISLPTEVEPYDSVTLTTTVQGNYKQVKDFLIALEEHERLILIRNYSIGGTAGDLSCTISFSIFAEGFEQLTPNEAGGRTNPFEDR
jgi:Tfp pilus assembly protein PilO